ncbi:hypothetical protein BSKO_05131 [Bryopsis sp. KO-2023]|nr:hypothetical protein BSKO_05131 [Bryopsis sp. KO-2023]
MRGTFRLVALLSILWLHTARYCSCFQLPGVAPRDFDQNEEGYFKVNKLASTKTQLPFEYYSLPYCRPGTIKRSAENLGEVLKGDRILNSPYQFKFRVDEECKVLCQKTFTEKEVGTLRDRIDSEYRVHMIFDNLPLGMVRNMEDKGRLVRVYEQGFPVGFKAAYKEADNIQYWIYNHLRFTILYHKNKAAGGVLRVVGFEVKPFTVQHSFIPSLNNTSRLATCDPKNLISVSLDQTPQEVVEGQTVTFTYDVFFRESTIRWGSRWDMYFFIMGNEIHWFSIMNSLMVVLFLSGVVAMILLRTLRREIGKYNQLENLEEAQEETGWKLVHGDVFRPPTNVSWLCVFVGSGVQLMGMGFATMLFAVLGWLSPANRGALQTAMLVSYVLMGSFGGFASAFFHKSMKGTDWRRTTLRTALIFPGACFGVCFILNLLIWGHRSSGAINFSSLITIFCLWIGISVPLVFLGSYFGYKRPALKYPVRTNQIPKQISPNRPCYTHPVLTCMLGGLLPFAAVFIQLFFVLTSIWQDHLYYVFGFLAVGCGIMTVTCAEIAIVLCYFQLCSEDYRWWWRSFLTAGSSAVYLYLYSGFYFVTKLDITMVTPMLMYFGYMGLISFAVFCYTGMVGFVSCLVFVIRIYGAVKFD